MSTSSKADTLPNALNTASASMPDGLLDSKEFAQLKLLVKNPGLLDKQPGYYTFKILLTLGLLALSLAVLVTVDTLWVQLLNAVFMAFVFTQIGLVGHDAGHQQIFRSPFRNDVILLVVSFIIGLDRSWWIDKHTRHHNNPNHVDKDFDVNLPLLAFTEEQAMERRGLYRWVIKYQSILVTPLMLLEAISIRLDGAQYLIRRVNVKYPLAESLFVGAHFLVYFGLIFYLLSAWHATLFILVQQGLTGVYMGTVFAANHKGMLMVGKDSKLDFLRRQVLTSRNIKGNPIVDFVYGGLNYQIEHHLFPSIPRNKLKSARKVIKEFCQSRSISYHETGVVQSYTEIIRYLHEVSGVLRRSRPDIAGGSVLPSNMS